MGDDVAVDVGEATVEAGGEVGVCGEVAVLVGVDVDSGLPAWEGN